MPSEGIFELTRRQAEALKRPKAEPPPGNYAPGSMEYIAQQAANQT